jgi:hypothetical protein
MCCNAKKAIVRPPYETWRTLLFRTPPLPLGAWGYVPARLVCPKLGQHRDLFPLDIVNRMVTGYRTTY